MLNLRILVCQDLLAVRASNLNNRAGPKNPVRLVASCKTPPPLSRKSDQSFNVLGCQLLNDSCNVSGVER